MREIKFRVWYEGPFANEMIYPDLYWFEEEGIREIPNDYATKYKVMQYTGLKDKQGKEIYEGDIVKGTAAPMRVIFLDGSFILADRDMEKRGAYTDMRIFNNAEKAITMWEVIGNIYEHPELLR